jgi:hypothetical protein
MSSVPLPFDHLIIVLDESESMKKRKSEIIEAVNKFIESIASGVLFSFVTFNDTSFMVIDRLPQVPLVDSVDYNPKGMTALYDAIGQVITTSVREGERTLCCVVTDGEENSSKIFTSLSVRDLISSKGDSLQMIYLGSNQDTILNGNAFGISDSDCIAYEDDEIDSVFECLGSAISRGGGKIVFTEEEKKKFTRKGVEAVGESDDDDCCIFETLGSSRKFRSK